MADGELDARLDMVKKGFDPLQVKRLVATLSEELKSLDAENASLRRQLDEALATPPTAPVAAAPPVAVSPTTDDIISSWTRETSEMLDGARQHVSRIMEKANTDAASIVAAATADAAAVRQRAQQEADEILAEAQAQADQTMLHGQERDAAAVLETERRCAEMIVAAERRSGDTTRQAEMARTGAQAELDQIAADVQRRRDELTDLEHERMEIREQLVNTQVYLQGLVALIEPGSSIVRDNS
jgi:cell division septum initiation protein DivIVA